ncbi:MULTISPECIES: hypothetical protein [unclassified Streptomyces]|uniref:hypothetical protein n=1 Tax=unclassified Streptomyces TaxID=2593676 RepID=UPI001369F76D|nr:hypothetical protein [Streptomyces sp. SID335]MYZ14055.1 hypothetical protein [Streptomyces sp. SID337]NDZ84619.1 hypothetical protein [Streptomyces sp. SID10115]NEB44258.1 hypothetical protein [Streptomyces sp. SID339]
MPKSVRGPLSAALLVLACVLVPLGVLSIWATYEIGDRDSYVATMAPLASDPAVRAAVADEVTGSVMKEIDVGPLQGTVESFVRDAVASFTETASYKTAWNAANRAAHDAVQSALNDDSSGEVTIDLAPITQQVKQQLVDDGVPFASKIPVKHTDITVLQSKDLGWLWHSFHALQVAGVWPAVAAAILAAAGILLAGRRRRAVLATALGMAVGAAILAAAVAIGRALTLDDLPTDISHDAAGAVYDALTETLRVTAWVIIGVMVVVAVAAWLGPRVRRRA